MARTWNEFAPLDPDLLMCKEGSWDDGTVQQLLRLLGIHCTATARTVSLLLKLSGMATITAQPPWNKIRLT